MENRISGKPFQFDQNLPHLTRKSFYRIILPSNRFRVMCKREREREKERERDSTEERSHQHPASAKARSIQELRRTQKTQDRARSSSNAPIVRLRTHSSDRRARPLNPIVRSWTHSSNRRARPSNPFLRSRTQIVSPRSSRRIADLLALGRSSSRSISSSIRLLSDFGLISDLMNFFAGYWEFGFWWIWILLELMIYLFGCWENARKCEKHDKIGFF